MPSQSLDIGDAAELAEMLQFLSDWLAADPGLDASLNRLIGHPAYGISQLSTDLERFTFLLSGNDGEHLFHDDRRDRGR